MMNFKQLKRAQMNLKTYLNILTIFMVYDTNKSSFELRPHQPMSKNNVPKKNLKKPKMMMCALNMLVLFVG